MRGHAVQDDLERMLRVIMPQNHGRYYTQHPGALHDGMHPRFVALEAMPLSFKGLKDERFEVPKVIVHNPIDLPSE